MSADSPSAADLISRFAELVDSVDTAGVTIVDYDTNRLVNSGDLQGTIDLRIDGVPADDVEPVEVKETDHSGEPIDLEEELEDVEIDAQEIIDELEDYHVDADDAPADASATPETTDQEDVDVPSESDVTPADVDDENEQESDDPDPDSPLGRVLWTLRDEGEMAGTELRTVAEVGNVYNVISKLDDEGLIAKRDDPDDGRRTLYRPAEMGVDEADDQEQDDGPLWNGEDPETIVADSSLPARVVLEDILDAARSASTVIEMAESLDVDVDNLEMVTWKLTLKKPNSLEIVDGAEEQIETIREVADGE